MNGGKMYSSRFIVRLLAVLLSFPLFLSVGGHLNAASDTVPRTFSTPQAAADALIDAAEKFDVTALEQIFGPGGKEILHSGEPGRDQEIAKQFAEQARDRMDVSIDPKTKR